MLVGAEALRILVSRHQHLIHSRSPHSVPTKVLLPVALCCASQVRVVGEALRPRFSSSAARAEPSC